MAYRNKIFSPPTSSSITELIFKHPFADLITHDKDRLEVSHLPFLYLPEEGASGTLYVHLARANPQFAALKRVKTCLVLFHGPESYISPEWYAADAEDHIPTWNYAVVQARGKPELIEDPEKVFWQMDQIHRLEEGDALTTVREEEKAQLIPQVGLFRIPVERIEAIFKLSQNRSEDDARGAMQALARSGDTKKKELSEWMRRSLGSRGNSNLGDLK